MKTPAEKGDALQQAVHAIEQCILMTSPALRENPFVIEQKKVVCVDGVRHEIDIFVTVHLAAEYEPAIYIFECKNWKKAVGKTEIVDFAEKVKAVNAAHGYFIAKSFSKYAKAQAQKRDARLTLRVVNESDDVSGLPVPGYLHFTETIMKGVDIRFDQRNRTEYIEQILGLATIHAESRGSLIDLPAYVGRWADDIMGKDSLSVPSHRVPEGGHARAASGSRLFAPGDLVLNGKEIESGCVNVSYQVNVYRPPVISLFDVETRGRVSSLAPVKSQLAGTVNMRIVEPRT